jgi:hypothetical protein
LRRLRQPGAQGDERPRHPIGEGGNEECDPEERKEGDRGVAAILVDRDGPAAAERCQAGNGGKGRRHAEEQGQYAAQEGLAGASEHERQHRQDAGADDGQNAAQISQDEEDHGCSLRPVTPPRA